MTSIRPLIEPKFTIPSCLTVMKILNLVIFIPITMLLGCSSEHSSSKPQDSALLNTLTTEEIAEGWQLLFDGTSMEHWRVYNQPDIPDLGEDQGWQVEDGLMVFKPVRNGNWSAGQDIITKQKYADFELALEWSIQEGGNSGIFYHVIEQPKKALYWSGPEMQILDNENHPDSDQGRDGNRKAGSLYDLIPAVPQNANPHGQWNSVRIVSSGPVIEHWQNGERVLTYTRWTKEWQEMISNSKFAEHPEFGQATEGHIALQDHGDVVKFRNIKIREISLNN